ncbi:hypothetical protein WMF20_24920 [Sorangium sp. So ce834]|uniref:hypothetical protein n=1 Tax=Sorangium sp. So ce834 TaxID=3133321 RepID=UPI003F633E55
MGLGAAGRRLVRGLSALALLGAGCEVLVDGKLETVLCSEEGAIGPPACPEGAVCSDGACVDTQLERALGAPCDDHDGCGTHDFCLDLTRLGGKGPSVCARACCSSSDCDPVRDAICWIPDGGGSGVCRIGRDVGRPEVGARLSGAACASPGECRSGICDEGVCVDTCCSDTNCARNGAACRLTTDLVAAGSAWACQRVGPGQGGYLDPCEGGADCSSGLCADVGGATRCTIPCCSSDMCPAAPDEPDEPDNAMRNVGCAEVAIDDGSTVRACATLLPEDSIAAVGVSCDTNEECRSGMCVKHPEQTQQFCSDVCCSEASCGDVSLFGCRPPAEGPSWALRCGPK